MGCFFNYTIKMATIEGKGRGGARSKGGAKKGTVFKGLTVERVAKALVATGGIYTESAKYLKCNRQTVVNRINSSPTLQRLVEELRESMLDTAQNHIHRIIREGDDAQTLRWYLGTMGAARGFSTKQEVKADVQVRQLKPFSEWSESDGVWEEDAGDQSGS